jgi:hypothetical protein
MTKNISSSNLSTPTAITHAGASIVADSRKQLGSNASPAWRVWIQVENSRKNRVYRIDERGDNIISWILLYRKSQKIHPKFDKRERERERVL